jgi:hypothetical protein
MARSKVRLKAHRHIYIHNDIEGVVSYFKDRVEQRLAKGEDQGVGSEIMAGLVLLAFEVEAKFNFLGRKLIKDWDEWLSLTEKVEKVCSNLDVEPDFKARPYLSIKSLKRFRNTLAHGKPRTKKFDREVTGSATRLKALRIPRAKWETFVNDPRLFYDAYSDVQQIWTTLRTKAGLSVLDTLSGGGSETSFLDDSE